MTFWMVFWKKLDDILDDVSNFDYLLDDILHDQCDILDDVFYGLGLKFQKTLDDTFDDVKISEYLLNDVLDRQCLYEVDHFIQFFPLI